MFRIFISERDNLHIFLENRRCFHSMVVLSNSCSTSILSMNQYIRTHYNNLKLLYVLFSLLRCCNSTIDLHWLVSTLLSGTCTVRPIWRRARRIWSPRPRGWRWWPAPGPPRPPPAPTPRSAASSRPAPPGSPARTSQPETSAEAARKYIEVFERHDGW